MSSTAGGSCFDPPSSSSSLYYSQAALSGLGGSHGSLQDPGHMRSNMLYSNCSGGLPNIILTGTSDSSSLTRPEWEEPVHKSATERDLSYLYEPPGGRRHPVFYLVVLWAQACVSLCRFPCKKNI